MLPRRVFNFFVCLAFYLLLGQSNISNLLTCVTVNHKSHFWIFFFFYQENHTLCDLWLESFDSAWSQHSYFDIRSCCWYINNSFILFLDSIPLYRVYYWFVYPFSCRLVLCCSRVMAMTNRVVMNTHKQHSVYMCFHLSWETIQNYNGYILWEMYFKTFQEPANCFLKWFYRST